MRSLLRLSMVWLLAVLFAASGVTMNLCAAAHHASDPAVAAQLQAAGQAQHAHAASDEHASHDHGAAEHDHAAGDTAHDDSACDKCCGSCTLATGVMPGMLDEAFFVVSPAVFAWTPDRCSDSAIRVDPGIPKSIV